MTAIVNTIGVISGALTIFSFGLTELRQVPSNRLDLSLKIGLNGAKAPFGETPVPSKEGGLASAGGKIDIAVYDNQGNKIGETLPSRDNHNLCGDGADDCRPVVEMYQNKQPSYTLFMGQGDGICIAAATVTYPGGDKYGWVGNWARECGAEWYYSDIDARTTNGSTKLICAWLDSDDDNGGSMTTITAKEAQLTSSLPAPNSTTTFCTGLTGRVAQLKSVRGHIVIHFTHVRVHPLSLPSLKTEISAAVKELSPKTTVLSDQRILATRPRSYVIVRPQSDLLLFLWQNELLVICQTRNYTNFATTFYLVLAGMI
ncbi:hypothetical protein VB005_04377 [Metarhizium brunneum]